MPPLDVSGASHEEKKKILEYASDVRKFEIGLFWQRSLFFWGFIGAAFVGYGVLITISDKDFALAISCFGMICSIAWTLQNRGSKYWQEAWEQKCEAVEMAVLNVHLFSNIEPVEYKGWLGAARFSVSKLAIALSDFTVLVWIILVWKALPNRFRLFIKTPDQISTLLIAITIVYIFVLFLWGRSGKKR